MNNSIEYLLNHDFKAKEINEFLEDGHEDFESVVIALWKESGIKVVDACRKFKPSLKLKDFKEFLEHCTACGGDWGQMLLTGIKEICPEAYEAIPNDMGIFAFVAITSTINLLGITTG